MIALHLFAVLLLVGMNAFFSAAEFSLVAIRLSRVRQLVEEGDPRAKIVEALLGDLGRVVSGVQVGITVASLLLGYFGEVTLAGILSPLLEAIPHPWAAVVLSMNWCQVLEPFPQLFFFSNRTPISPAASSVKEIPATSRAL